MTNKQIESIETSAAEMSKEDLQSAYCMLIMEQNHTDSEIRRLAGPFTDVAGNTFIEEIVEALVGQLDAEKS